MSIMKYHHNPTTTFNLPPIPMALKINIQRQHPPLKRTPKSPLPTLIPLPIDNLKRHILIRRPSAKPQYAKVVRIRPFQRVQRSLRPVDQVGIKNIELVALDSLGGRIVVIVMGLVVRVPIVPGLDAVEVPWFAGTVLVLPCVDETGTVFGVEVDFVVETELFLEVAKVWFHSLRQWCSGCCGIVICGGWLLSVAIAKMEFCFS
mmetsp:Transcript_199/g.328  ORF Transcript_199/g.328 Transcript_199/m.328 type:complete len:204 (+) Transcript_199:220-831(+)